MGEFLGFLDAHHLRDEVIVVVTGDHGLRGDTEFESVKEKKQVGEAALNVPLMIYAPGLFGGRIELAHVTSHVDIAPTLLELVGIDLGPFFHHGASVLDQEIRDRVSFFMNSTLNPVDGFCWRGRIFSFDNRTGASEVSDLAGRRPEPLEDAVREGPSSPPALRTPGTVLARAAGIFDATAAYFISRTKTSLVPVRAGH